MYYKLEKFYDEYGLDSRTGDFSKILPSFDISSVTSLTFSEYFDKITFDLDELISGFEVSTHKSSGPDNQRYLI